MFGRAIVSLAPLVVNGCSDITVVATAARCDSMRVVRALCRRQLLYLRRFMTPDLIDTKKPLLAH